MPSLTEAPEHAELGTALPQSAADGPRTGHRRHRRARLILGCVGLALVAAAGLFTFLWFHSGPHQESMSTAIQRFRSGATTSTGTAGPPAGVYLYRGSGTETLSVPPKSQSEGPGIPGTITHSPGGCFVFRLDYSTAHWQSWTYCVRSGTLVSPSRAGYYKWDFVAFSVNDTSTFTCHPAAATIPVRLVAGTRLPLTCTGANNHLSIAPVHMRGYSTVVRTGTVRIGRDAVPAVEVREQLSLSGGQHGTNSAETWFSVSTGMPLRGNWDTVVTTASPVGNSTLTAHGTFTLSSTTPHH